MLVLASGLSRLCLFEVGAQTVLLFINSFPFLLHNLLALVERLLAHFNGDQFAFQARTVALQFLAPGVQPASLGVERAPLVGQSSLFGCESVCFGCQNLAAGFDLVVAFAKGMLC